VTLFYFSYMTHDETRIVTFVISSYQGRLWSDLIQHSDGGLDQS